MGWAPHTVTTTEVVEHGPIAALSALFDDETHPVKPGEVLPPLWHWAALPRWPVSSLLGPDGHPSRGSFLPPVGLPRRMFAGGVVSFHADLTVGSSVRRESTVVSVTEKSGRSGPLVVVVVETRLYDGQGRLAVEERQDLIYRGAGRVSPSEVSSATASQMTPVGTPLRRTGEWSWNFATDPTLLLRFSAATSNAHRIHYDWPYATQVEGYPGLVVHGPFMTLALAEVLRLEAPSARVTRVAHRNLRPLFCGQPAQIGRLNVDQLQLGLFRCDETLSPETTPITTLTIDLDPPECDL